MCAMGSCIKVVKTKKFGFLLKKKCCLRYPSKAKTATFLFWVQFPSPLTFEQVCSLKIGLRGLKYYEKSYYDKGLYS
jgi:hypothetical protein